MRTQQLPIYTEILGEATYALEQKKPNPLERIFVTYIRPIRVSLQDMCTKAQECVVKYQYSASKASTSIANMLRDEPVLLTRYCFIATCGLGGWILGYKGGILKKMSYASISGSVAIVLCFPNSAFSAATNLWHIESKKMTEIKKRFSD